MPSKGRFKNGRIQWRARVKIQGQEVFLGEYDTKQEAADREATYRGRNQARIEYVESERRRSISESNRRKARRRRGSIFEDDPLVQAADSAGSLRGRDGARQRVGSPGR
jgi:hypothetical protein